MTPDTTSLSYWLNWRFLLCALWVLIPMVVASIMIWKYEGSDNSKPDQHKAAGYLYKNEAWRTCLKDIHPAWLLALRIIGFFVLLSMLIANVIVDGPGIFFYYTQWTFALVTVYFGLGSLLSVYGCYQYHNRVGDDWVDCAGLDAEQGIYIAPMNEESSGSYMVLNSSAHEKHYVCQSAGTWGCALQILFQMNAGAVLLTDCVFWFIIVPFLSEREDINNMSFLKISMHSINAVFLLGDAALNCLRFPWFRIAYCVLWTAVYVIFQWVVHAFVSMGWPYPILDLSTPYAPLWYLLVAMLHLPCYGIFALIIRMKQSVLSRWVPQSNQFTR